MTDDLRKIRPGFFPLYMNEDKKRDYIDFIKLSLDGYYNSFGLIPASISVNETEVKFLGKNRGVLYKGHKIPVDIGEYTLPMHLELH